MRLRVFDELEGFAESRFDLLLERFPFRRRLKRLPRSFPFLRGFAAADCVCCCDGSEAWGLKVEEEGEEAEVEEAGGGADEVEEEEEEEEGAADGPEGGEEAGVRLVGGFATEGRW